MKTAYWPVAFEFSTSLNGNTILGPETIRACHSVIKTINRDKSLDYVVIPSAGRPDPKKWGNVWMARMMSNFLIDNGISDEFVIPLEGKKFNTQFEAKAVVDFLKINSEIKRLVICVKWWHALRVWNWINLYLKKNELYQVDVVIVTCESFVSIETIQKEFWLTYPWNLIKMWFVLKLS